MYGHWKQKWQKNHFVVKDLQMKIIFVSDIGSLETFVVYVFLNYSLLYNDSDYLDKVIEIFGYAVSIWDLKAKKRVWELQCFAWALGDRCTVKRCWIGRILVNKWKNKLMFGFWGNQSFELLNHVPCMWDKFARGENDYEGRLEPILRTSL